MDELTRHTDRLPDCDCHECALHERDRLRAENEALRRLIAHVAERAEFDESSCKDWRAWIADKLAALSGEGD